MNSGGCGERGLAANGCTKDMICLNNSSLVYRFNHVLSLLNCPYEAGNLKLCLSVVQLCCGEYFWKKKDLLNCGERQHCMVIFFLRVVDNSSKPMLFWCIQVDVESLCWIEVNQNCRWQESCLECMEGLGFRWWGHYKVRLSRNLLMLNFRLTILCLALYCAV